VTASQPHPRADHTLTPPRATAWPIDVRPLAAAIILGLVLESVPLSLGAALGPPYAWVIAPFGFILAWAAIVASRQPDGTLDLAGGLRSLPRLLGRLLAAYGMAVCGIAIFAVAAAIAIGLWLHGILAGVLVMAATISLVCRFVYVIPSIAHGDDLVAALERAWLLAHARGLPGLVFVILLAVAALGPPIAVAELTSPVPMPVPLLATLGTLAMTGPILSFGLERARPWLEAAVRRRDPSYGLF